MGEQKAIHLVISRFMDGLVDYIIVDQELYFKVNYFIVKRPSYLSHHSRIVAWLNIEISDQMRNKLRNETYVLNSSSDLPAQFI